MPGVWGGGMVNRLLGVSSPVKGAWEVGLGWMDDG